MVPRLRSGSLGGTPQGSRTPSLAGKGDQMSNQTRKRRTCKYILNNSTIPRISASRHPPQVCFTISRHLWTGGDPRVKTLHNALLVALRKSQPLGFSLAFPQKEFKKYNTGAFEGGEDFFPSRSAVSLNTLRQLERKRRREGSNFFFPAKPPSWRTPSLSCCVKLLLREHILAHNLCDCGKGLSAVKLSPRVQVTCRKCLAPHSVSASSRFQIQIFSSLLYHFKSLDGHQKVSDTNVIRKNCPWLRWYQSFMFRPPGGACLCHLT